jgi:hypothetical protein
MTDPSSSSTTDDAGKHTLPLSDDGVGLTLARVPLGRIVSVALGSAVSVAFGRDVATGSAVALAAATAVGDTVVVCCVAELLNPVAAVVALGLVGAVAVLLAAGSEVGEAAVDAGAGTGAVPFVGGAGVGAEASSALIQKLPHIPAPGVRRGPQTRLESQHGK